MEHIGITIKRIRKEHNLSISKLSRMSGVSRGYIYLIEKGENNPTWDKLVMLAHALNTSIVFGNSQGADMDELPESLNTYAEKCNVPYQDVLMLSKISYRGKTLSTPLEWELLHRLIITLYTHES